MGIVGGTLRQMWAHVYVHSVEGNYIHSAPIDIADEFLCILAPAHVIIEHRL